MEGGNFNMMNKNLATPNPIALQPSGTNASTTSETNAPPTNGTNASPRSSRDKGKGKQYATDAKSPIPKAAPLGRPPLPPSSLVSQPGQQECQMPSANILRVMRSVLPQDAKISEDTKHTMQKCLSEFILFITEEANDQCQKEKRKTVTAEDLLTSLWRLGFVSYVPSLLTYIKKYREQDSTDQRRASRLHQLNFTRRTITGPAVMPNIINHHHLAKGYIGASHGSTSTAITTTRPPADMVSPTMTVLPQHMVGPNTRTPTIGVGFGASHGSASTITVTNMDKPSIGVLTQYMPVPSDTSGVEFGDTYSHGSANIATATATAGEHEFSPMGNMRYNGWSSSNNDGSFDFDGDTELPRFSNCSACHGYVNQDDESFNHHFDHFE